MYVSIWFYLNTALLYALYIAGFVLIIYLIKLVKVLLKRYSEEKGNEDQKICFSGAPAGHEHYICSSP